MNWKAACNWELMWLWASHWGLGGLGEPLDLLVFWCYEKEFEDVRYAIRWPVKPAKEGMMLGQQDEARRRINAR